MAARPSRSSSAGIGGKPPPQATRGDGTHRPRHSQRHQTGPRSVGPSPETARPVMRGTAATSTVPTSPWPSCGRGGRSARAVSLSPAGPARRRPAADRPRQHATISPPTAAAPGKMKWPRFGPARLRSAPGGQRVERTRVAVQPAGHVHGDDDRPVTRRRRHRRHRG